MVSDSRMCVAASCLFLALACAASAPTPRELPIPSPPQPLEIAVGIREGSFVRSHLSARGVLQAFAEQLAAARIFSEVLPLASESAWELELAASDYGAEDAYTLELQALLLHRRELRATYFSKQSLRQAAGSGRELLVGPEQLAGLAERAIRELLRQLALDAERLRSEGRVGTGADEG